MEVLSLLKEMSMKGNLMCKIDLKGCLFYNPFSKEISEKRQILMNGPDIRVSLSTSWSVFSTIGFCKVNQNPHTQALGQNYIIPRRFLLQPPENSSYWLGTLHRIQNF